MQAQTRAAAVQLLADYASDAGSSLQVYPGRPRSLMLPSAFVDTIDEQLTDYTTTTRQRIVQARVLVLHGLYDAADTTAQRDAFVDGFLDWVVDRYHAAGANTLLSVTTVEDVPGYVPDWLPVDAQRLYHGTRITLEGFAAT